MRDGGNVPLAEALTAFLREREMLFILDNFEHVLDAAAGIADLLAVAPSLTFLITSRIRLDLQAEYVFPVSPLALPDPRRYPRHHDWPTTTRFGCSFYELRHGSPASPSPRTTRRSSWVSAPGSMACPSRSSWPPRASRICLRRRSWPGSTGDCPS